MIQNNFDFTNFVCQEKVDGSLVILYYYKDKFRFNTRGSFAQGKPCELIDKSWSELFYDCINRDNFPLLNKDCSYIFEYTSRYNKVVIDYPTSALYLLSAFNNKTHEELSIEHCDEIAKILEVKRPKLYNIKSVADIEKFLDEQPTASIEGFVIRDSNNNRLKIKDKKYIALHHLKGNSNLFLAKNLLPFILAGETKEVLAYFPEAQTAIDKLEKACYTLLDEATALWNEAKGIESQKDFALKVKDSKVSSLLFNARKTGKSIKELLWDSPDYILKLYKE